MTAIKFLAVVVEMCQSRARTYLSTVKKKNSARLRKRKTEVLFYCACRCVDFISALPERSDKPYFRSEKVRDAVKSCWN